VFKPGRGVGYLRTIKVCSTPSFRREVKTSHPCRKILWQEGKKNIFRRQIHHFLRTYTDLIPDGSAGRITRSTLWANQEFSSVDIILRWSHMITENS
jgi:hypothetical protein